MHGSLIEADSVKEPDPLAPSLSMSQPRSKSEQGLIRTESKGRDSNRITNRERKRVREGHHIENKESLLKESDPNPISEIDYSVIAVFSREAVENFAKQWKALVHGDLKKALTKESQNALKAGNHDQNLNSIRRDQLPASDMPKQFASLFEGRDLPHVIGVTEGNNTVDDFSLAFKSGDFFHRINYKFKTLRFGENSNGSLDERQSMSFYVREDLEGAYSFTDEVIKTPLGDFTVGGISYQTEDSVKFRTLLVHIPNKISNNIDVVQKAIQAYASDLKDHIVTSYFGDTNFKKRVQKYSTLSTGGIGENGEPITLKSSAADKDTFFMQAIELESKKNDFEVLQPSALNMVTLVSDDKSRTGVDHPSFIHRTLHTKKLKGRDPSKNPEYYSQIVKL